MKSISVLYEDESTITSLIQQEQLQQNLPYFVQIITASKEPEEALKLSRFLQDEFPNATIMGFSACGIIFKGEQLAEGTMVLFHAYEKTKIFQASFTWKGKSAYEIASEVANSIADKTIQLMHVICGNYYWNAHDFVEEFNKQNNETIMVGGIAGDIITKNIPGYVFTPEGLIEDGIIIAAFSGSDLKIYNGVNTSHEPISGKHKLTKTEDNAWIEVNGQGIREWLFEQLGIDKFEDYSDWQTLCANDILVHFPMVLEKNQDVSRFLRYDSQANRITQYYSRIPEGSEFRIGYLNPTNCLQESFRLCSEVMSQPIEDLFCYSCLFRRLYLQNCSEWELSPYKNSGICGAYMMGEISNINGINEFLNGSCCLVGIAENETFIRPNIKVFNELTAIGEDTTDLLNMVLKCQQETTTRQNEKLMKTLIEQQESQKKQKYIDFNTGQTNYLKYKEDLKTQQFDKLCVIKIENAELLITHLGHTYYLKILRNILLKFQETLYELRDQEHTLMQLYVFNESIFFIASDERMSERHFMNICKNIHDTNHFAQLDDQEVVVNRFVVCLNQKDPLESALNALAANKNTQNSFLVYQDNNETSSNEEFKMIGVLNRAFEKNGVIPYFQGIYSNKEKRIAYYEALMRIQDTDGTVYAPGQFIDVAKKYHMYANLSRIMIRKVFDLFVGRDEIISINVSAFDIHSETTKEMIYQCLRACHNPKNYVFEILEDEAYKDFAPLKDFIANVQKLGARVAIDDFGAGYSNLYEISNIHFDIIKVDGGIIRNLPNNECNKKLLDVITYMGVLFEAEIVAEFVENQEIQSIIEKTGIAFSQGYLFAVPVPFDKMDEV